MKIDPTTPSYTVTNVGVWRVLIAKSALNLRGKELKDSFSVLPLLLIFVAEIYALAPDLVVFFILTKVWSGIQSSLVLYTSNHLLTVVSN
jgi:Na+/H+ antiporter NhaB